MRDRSSETLHGRALARSPHPSVNILTEVRHEPAHTCPAIAQRFGYPLSLAVTAMCRVPIHRFTRSGRPADASSGESRFFGVESRPARDELIEQARSALRAGDAASARILLDEANTEHPDDADVLEGLGRAAYLDLDFQAAIEHWQRAYAGFRAAGDQFGAVRVARSLAPTYGMVLGDGAVMSGWMARAQTLLGESMDSPEAGLVALNIGMFEGDRARKDEHLRRKRWSSERREVLPGAVWRSSRRTQCH